MIERGLSTGWLVLGATVFLVTVVLLLFRRGRLARWLGRRALRRTGCRFEKDKGFFYQDSALSCGAAITQTILLRCGLANSAAVPARLGSLRGTSLADLRDRLEGQGLRVSGRRGLAGIEFLSLLHGSEVRAITGFDVMYALLSPGRRRALQRRGLPRLNFSHWVGLESLSDPKWVRVLDTELGVYCMPVERFLQEWSGTALMVEGSTSAPNSDTVSQELNRTCG